MENEKYYNTTCPSCENSFKAQPSLGHLLGSLKAGFAMCPSCNVFLNLQFDPVNQTMTSIIWGEGENRND